MAPKVSTSLLFLLPFIFLASSVVAFDIVEILEPYGDFKTFIKYLTDTKVAEEINRRKSTLLAVADNAIGPLASLNPDDLKKVMSIHVVIDYYDPYTLSKLPKTALLRTLFEDSGLATNQMGYLNYTELPGEQMLFGSAVPGSPHNSILLKVVTARPYDLSVLQISVPIVPQGIENTAEPGIENTAEPGIENMAEPGIENMAAAAASAADLTQKLAQAKLAPESSLESPAEDAATTETEKSPAKAGESSDKQSEGATTVVSAFLGLIMGAIALGAI